MEAIHTKSVKEGNTLTICNKQGKDAMYYLRLVRFHFKKAGSSEAHKVLVLQSLGLSCQNLVFVAALVTMKGYATYKRIKNDTLAVPTLDEQTQQPLGWVKKVRLTVKLLRSDKFDEIIAMEEEAERKAMHLGLAAPKEEAKRRLYNTEAPSKPAQLDASSGCSGNPDSSTLSKPGCGSAEVSTTSVPRDISGLSSEFDQDDLVLKTTSQAQFDMQRYLQQDDDDIANLLRDGDADFYGEDPNFIVNEADLMADDEDDDEDGETPGGGELEEGEVPEKDFAFNVSIHGSSIDHAPFQQQFASMSIDSDQPQRD